MRGKLFYTFIYLTWLTPAVLFAFTDLEISIQIAKPGSVWAELLEKYGMIPGLLVILSGIYIYYSHIKLRTNVWSYFQKSVFFIVGSGIIFYLFEIVISNTVNKDLVNNHLIIFWIISSFISIIIFIAIHFKSRVQSAIAIRYAEVVLGMALFGYVIFIQGVKYFWGRVRFRELDAAFSQFTPWYLPQGFNGFDSFPSGHAAMGWMLLPVLILLSDKKEWIKKSAFALIFVWAFVLALSRVVIGAHYASDVLFGSFFILIVFVIFNRNHKHQATNNK